MSNRYRLITGLSAAVVIVAILLCFCFISFNNIEDIFAFNNTNIAQAVDIGDILLEEYEKRSDGKVFDIKAMSALYAKLTGDENKSNISDVAKLGTLTAAGIRDNNDGADLVLTICGQQWTVTYLTKDKSGNTILTLWKAYEA